MNLVLTLFHGALILVAGYFIARRWGEVTSKLFWLTFIIHLAVAMGIGLVYQYYYASNDTWFFFDTAAKLADVAKQDFLFYINRLFDFSWEQGPYIPTHDFRSVIFIKMISVFCLAGCNYWVCAAYFSLLSFCASWFLFRKVNAYFQDSKVAASMAFLIFPSVVFWSSGIEKETLTLAALYFLAGIFLQIFFDRKIEALVLFLAFLASVVLWTLKYYWAGVFFMSAITTLVVHLLSPHSLIVQKNRMLTFLVLFGVIGAGVSLLHPNFYLHRILEVLVSNHDAFVPLSNDQSLVHYYHLNASVESVIINAPWALWSGIFRPLVGEGRGIFGLLASIENMVILLLFLSAFMNFKNRLRGRTSVLTLGVVMFCIVLCIFLSLSTPNLGTLSRYRVGFLPFFIFLITYRNPLVDFVIRKLSR